MEVVDPEVFITPLPTAHTLVNGKIITERTKLCHGYRVLLGINHFFQLSCPKQKGKFYPSSETVFCVATVGFIPIKNT